MLSVVYIQGLAALTHEKTERRAHHAPPDQAQPTTESAAASAAAPELERFLTHEDVDRARDRWEAWCDAAGPGSFGGVRLLWLLVGPGVLVFLGENRCAEHASTRRPERASGSVSSLVVLTFAMGFVVQEMTVRRELGTHHGHADLFLTVCRVLGLLAMGGHAREFPDARQRNSSAFARAGLSRIRPSIAVGVNLVFAGITRCYRTRDDH